MKALGAAVFLLMGGCAALQVGPQAKGLVVAAQGTADDAPEAVTAAERQAVDGVLELFISSATRAASGAALEEHVLSRPRAYISKYQVLAPDPKSAEGQVKLLALIATDKLLKDLDALGLVRPEGVFGTPVILIDIKETGFGAGRDAGGASDMLRRQLSARGYSVQDLSDHFAYRPPPAVGATVPFTGTARAQPLRDERLAGLQTWRARVEGRAAGVGPDGAPAEVSVEATAVDLTSATAAAKALANAGELAADQLALALSNKFRERSQLHLTVVGLGSWESVRGFVTQVRDLPGVAGAAVVGLAPREARLQVFVEKLAPDDLAALLMRLPGYSLQIRGVETDYRTVEVEATSRD